MTESQIFPIQPDLTQSLRILSYDFSVLENFDFFFRKYYAIDRRARNNHKNDSTINTFPFVLEQETHISSKKGAFVSSCTLCCYSFLAGKGDNAFHFNFNIFCPSVLGPGGFLRTVSFGSGNLTGP